jgi:hypothetical protein
MADICRQVLKGIPMFFKRLFDFFSVGFAAAVSILPVWSIVASRHQLGSSECRLEGQPPIGSNDDDF